MAAHEDHSHHTPHDAPQILALQHLAYPTEAFSLSVSSIQCRFMPIVYRAPEPPNS